MKRTCTTPRRRMARQRAIVHRGPEPVLRFDAGVFLRDFPARCTSAPLTIGPRRTAALTQLLGFISADPDWFILRQVAYMLATVRHETGGSFLPIKEWRAKVGTKHRQIQDRYWSSGYYGRGYVQLTWDWNYRKAGQKLNGRTLGGHYITSSLFLTKPDLLLVPAISYAVCARGMREGWFTGKKLDTYITATTTDYRNARRVVNGTDQAQRIATYANEFELLLRASLIEGS